MTVRGIGLGRGVRGLVACLVTLVVLPSTIAQAASEFTDVGGTVHEEDILAVASAGITRGCNPPVNDRFCPEDPVTRGQMAAFLVRALGLAGEGGSRFVDTGGSVFDEDAQALASAGITRGCNPPVNDRFCPEDPVTRGQMAAFLVRAFDYRDDGGGDVFVDDDGSVFEGEIDRLAASGVTRGCNPPANDRFCPGQVVTRGQMASFLTRALGLDISGGIDDPILLTSSPFASLPVPVGVVTDSSGSLTVSHDDIPAARLTRLDQGGNVLASNTIGDLAVGSLGYLAHDTARGVHWLVLPSGEIYFVDPVTLQYSLALDLRTVPIDTSSWYDVATETVGPHGGVVVTTGAEYRDISLRQAGDTTTVLIGGFSVAHPFVLRLTVEGGDLTEARVILGSIAADVNCGNSTSPCQPVGRGVAVNGAGTALTVLPIQLSTGTADTAVTFPVGYRPGVDPAPRFVDRDLLFSSRGMASDADGQFYVTTTEEGIPALGAPAIPVLLVLSPQLDSILAAGSTGASLDRFLDVAVAEADAQAYVTTGSGQVVRFGLQGLP